MVNFHSADVKSELTEFLRESFRSKKITVLKSDPLTVREIPCVAVNRAGDDEDSTVIGDIIDVECGKEFRGTFFRETYEVRIWHTNADERDKLYREVKALLVFFRKQLVSSGVLNAQIRGGRDEQENAMPPQPLFWGTITLTCLNPIEVEELLLEDIITDIEVSSL